MTTDSPKLPELPPHDETVEFGYGDVRVWEERSMRAYATAVLLAERARVEKLEAEWSRPDALRLKCGEMTAQEMRTAQAVLRGFASAIRSRT